MLDIVLSATDDLPAVKLSFEHSLLSVSKWESLHEKPFYGPQDKTEEETESYIRQMLLTQEPPANFYSRLQRPQFERIQAYINSKQTATTFGIEPEKKGMTEVVTAELIYYWFVQFQIPFHPTETWHMNRIMTLIKIAGIKQSKPKKQSRQQIAEQYRSLNEQRRKQSGTAG
jgi:hypothetical protein